MWCIIYIVSNINYKYDNIFIHVPKCAGTSMEKQEFVGGSSHAPAHVLKHIVGVEKWEKMFTWGFVRDPLDRFVSAFFAEPRTHGFQMNNKGFREFTYMMSAMGIDLEGSINGSGHHHHHFVPQYYFLCDNQDKIMVDYVGRYSSLEECWGDVIKRISVEPAELPHERQSNHGHYTSYYAGDDNLVRMVKELYARDYEIFEEF